MAQKNSYPDCPITFPPNAAAGDGDGTWDFDEKEIKKCLRAFGISLPVVFKYAGRAITRYGTHRERIRPQGNFHSITVCQYLSPAQATFTILHELAHAKQAEKYGMKEFFAIYKNDKRKFENAANAIAAKNLDRFSILY